MAASSWWVDVANVVVARRILLVVVRTVLELPKLDPGRYRLLGRLERRDGYQAVRGIRVVL